MVRGGKESVPRCPFSFLPTMVRNQHWYIEQLYFVLSIPFLLKQDVVPWSAGLGRTKMCRVLGSKCICFMPIKPPIPLQMVEQPISWAGHWWPEFYLWQQFFWVHIVAFQSGKWLEPPLTICNRAIRWGRDLDPSETSSVYMSWKRVWNPKVSSCSGFFVGSPSSFLLITYDRMKFTETFHFPDFCPRSRNSE